MFLEGYTIVFDLDGTLVETAPDLHRATNEIMRTEGLKEVSLKNVRAFVGQGARALIERGAAISGKVFKSDKLDELTSKFVEIYQADIAGRSHLFDNVETTLDALEAAGAQFCVCTNKKTHLAVRLLETLNIAHRFKSIVGADSAIHAKPHQQHYLQAVEEAGGDPKRSIMIGDSHSDVGAARNAGAPIVLVSFGYTDIAPIDLNPDAIIDDFNELPSSLLSLLKQVN
ncbi:HAD-IA family hydrolase [Hirschia baltica]|uniref:phosphoglycolate phosphatase n=1 Tax=Hirschia baltica (strain ATCC 49814 / DSM 5838 / IFAM 1418) TaxID=582402 RepID=C6XK94_HIRBI|nr:HAD-IA family hydrolase [Hirschia baltica]ACT59539.1 phosphoglycolate phosphatase [Hirschia baltica ATCC 49814]